MDNLKVNVLQNYAIIANWKRYYNVIKRKWSNHVTSKWVQYNDDMQTVLPALEILLISLENSD